MGYDPDSTELLKAVLPAYIEVANHLVTRPVPPRTKAALKAEITTYHANLSQDLTELRDQLHKTHSESAVELQKKLLLLLESRLNRNRLGLGPSKTADPQSYVALRAITQWQTQARRTPSYLTRLTAILCLHSDDGTRRARILRRIDSYKDELSKGQGMRKPIVFRLEDLRPTSSSAKKGRKFLQNIQRMAEIAHSTLCQQLQVCHGHIGVEKVARLHLAGQKSAQNPKRKSELSFQFELLVPTLEGHQTGTQWREVDLMINKDEELAQISLPKENTRPQPKQIPTVTINVPSDLDGEDTWPFSCLCSDFRLVNNSRRRLLLENGELLRLRGYDPKFVDLNEMSLQTLDGLIRIGQFQSFCEEDKYVLAHLIARSFTQLYSGSWLDEEWTKNIVFLMPKDDNIPHNLSSPFLTAQCATSKQGQSYDDGRLNHPDPYIMSLGILLLELELGTPIDTGHSVEDVSRNPNLLLARARQLLTGLQESKEVKFPDYLDAMNACLNPPSSVLKMSRSADDKRWWLNLCVVQQLQVVAKGYTERPNTTIPKLQSEAGPVMVEKAEGTAGATDEAGIELRGDQSKECLPAKSCTKGKDQPSQAAKVQQWLCKDSLDKTRVSADWFNDLVKRVHPLLKDPPQEPIKIAILDSGIDLPGKGVWMNYRNRIVWKDFTTPPSEVMTDTYGHGTHAAGLLLDVAPNARIYVGRITRDGKHFESKDIAEAIRYAHEQWKVNIINLSYGRDEVEPQIDQAILKATSISDSNLQPVIIFAAAANHGNRHGIAWPASADQVICVHATDGNGDTSFTPNAKADKSFATLGQAVLSYWPSSLQDEEKELIVKGKVWRDGTSFSTPIAAAIGAIILEYCNEERLLKYARKNVTERARDEYVIRTVRRIEGMKKVLGLMVEEKHGYQCLMPWNLLRDSSRVYESTICQNILEGLRK